MVSSHLTANSEEGNFPEALLRLAVYVLWFKGLAVRSACGRTTTKVLAHLVDLEGWLPGIRFGFLAEKFYTFSRLQRFVLLVGETIRFAILLTDEPVSTAGQAALQLGTVMVLPVKEATNHSCTGRHSSNDGSLRAIAAVRVVGGAARHSTPRPFRPHLRIAQQQGWKRQKSGPPPELL